MEPNTGTVYVGASNEFGKSYVLVISATTNAPVATIPLPAYAGPGGVAANPRAKIIFVADTDRGLVSVISARTNKVIATISLGHEHDPYQIAVDPRTNVAYITEPVIKNEVVVIGPCQHDGHDHR